MQLLTVKIKVYFNILITYQEIVTYQPWTHKNRALVKRVHEFHIFVLKILPEA